ncbi:hypothetical protein MRB53_022572 [Persea americana]|uniref:Uncharacterized protein n=1 Tax=Persea americana TaxID=3435 RepID=A0ACC2L876_PERAE|nr:hypothetical protein MRB53_022572 [Persea americana]|eukprot:TRINITY_DN9204_c0_g1_i10.p1 TRINITY_DN9204_c0_g1~~TRINITY_DN9204_c0_g1_i10.p1  ORF type:complete len:213 (-),score=34.78 TRINITY_DN9204_c0_g1_i10:3589-4227(-)
MAFFTVVVNQLSGSLPPDLGVILPNLIGFYVGGNRFTGPIPISLYNASRLEELELSSIQFSGSIPMKLGRLGGLRLLNLKNNILGSGEAEDMGSLSSLANCSLLQILSVTINQLTGALPGSTANLSSNLLHLYLGENQLFRSIPSGIDNLHNLTALTMDSIFMIGRIPEGIGKLSKLQLLHLHKNNFLGEFPSFIGNNTQLFSLFLGENNLE